MSIKDIAQIEEEMHELREDLLSRLLDSLDDFYHANEENHHENNMAAIAMSTLTFLLATHVYEFVKDTDFDIVAERIKLEILEAIELMAKDDCNVH